jgi:hypothetical protein
MKLDHIPASSCLVKTVHVLGDDAIKLAHFLQFGNGHLFYVGSSQKSDPAGAWSFQAIDDSTSQFSNVAQVQHHTALNLTSGAGTHQIAHRYACIC